MWLMHWKTQHALSVLKRFSSQRTVAVINKKRCADRVCLLKNRESLLVVLQHYRKSVTITGLLDRVGIYELHEFLKASLVPIINRTSVTFCEVYGLNVKALFFKKILYSIEHSL